MQKYNNQLKGTTMVLGPFKNIYDRGLLNREVDYDYLYNSVGIIDYYFASQDIISSTQARVVPVIFGAFLCNKILFLNKDLSIDYDEGASYTLEELYYCNTFFPEKISFEGNDWKNEFIYQTRDISWLDNHKFVEKYLRYNGLL